MSDAVDSDFAALQRPPGDWTSWNRWLARAKRWRDQRREELGYDVTVFDDPQSAWVGSNFVTGMAMLWDRRLFDPSTGRFTVDRFLESGSAVGGYDSLVLWHAYPLIGFDDRNQFDYYRNLPQGLAELVGQFHGRGVSVYLNYNPWDVGSRREKHDDVELLTELMVESVADGLFLDTMAHADRSLRNSLDQRRAGISLMAENVVPLEHVRDHQETWIQWPPDLSEPLLVRNMWFDQRQRGYLVRRWHLDHADEILTAWLNGAGIVYWDNVFGSPRRWSQGDLRCAAIVHRLWRCFGPAIRQGDWSPFVPTGHPDIQSSQWRCGSEVVIGVANRSRTAFEGWIDVDTTLEHEFASVGETVDTAPTRRQNKQLQVWIRVPASSAIAVVSAAQAPQTLDPLPEPAQSRAPAPPHRVRRGRTPDRTQVPPSMVVFPQTAVTMTSLFRERECGTYAGADLIDAEYPGLRGYVEHRSHVELGRFAIDRTPTRVEDYNTFAGETGRRTLAADPGAPARGVCLDDARAYASWRDARLPDEHEWQFAVQSGLVERGPSPSWEWTESEHEDEMNRFAILKGGTSTPVTGSIWYPAGEPDPRMSAKRLLFWQSIDASEGVGFRCAVDLA